jgi:hypothetical protein
MYQKKSFLNGMDVLPASMDVFHPSILHIYSCNAYKTISQKKKKKEKSQKNEIQY